VRTARLAISLVNFPSNHYNNDEFQDGVADTPDPLQGSFHPSKHSGSILEYMDYSVGSRIRVRLYSGKVVEAEITAITNQSTGRKLQIVYGSVTASVIPAQITEILPTT
jgi:hypothetical protein